MDLKYENLSDFEAIYEILNLKNSLSVSLRMFLHSQKVTDSEVMTQKLLIFFIYMD